MDSAHALQLLVNSSVAGPSSADAIALNQQLQGVTTNNGDAVLAGGNVSINHHHTYHAEPKLGVIWALRFVRNLRKIHLDILSKATPGTGIWLLKTDKFTLWLDINGTLKILWGSGIPGAGKTVMASLVINEVESKAAATSGSICVCYAYFRYSDASLTVRNVLEIFVKQTVERHPECAPLAEKAYARHLHEDTQPTEAELLQLLHLFIQRRSATFYILDALDEAPDKVQLELVKKLASLNVRLFITSRPLKGVERCVSGVHSFPIVAQEQDLELRINEEIEKSSDLQNLLKKAGPSLKGEIVTSIKEKCNGMFLHASLQLAALGECFSPGEVRRTLEAFPSSIEDVYLQTWSRIVTRNPTRVLLAKTVLLWVINAPRPMTIEELERAVATSPKTYKFEPDEVVPGINLVTLCRGLLTFEEESSVVRLVHYTAKGTLQKFLQDSFPHPHSHLAAVCITHLIDCGFQNTAVKSVGDFIAVRQADPLLAYSSDAWAFHARESLDAEETRQQVADFVGSASAFPTSTNLSLPEYFDILDPLHILANYNLPISFLANGNIGDPNVTTQIDQESPLMLASRHGHAGPVEFLLAHPRILVNLVSSAGWSALMLAAVHGHERIVKLILAHPDVEVNLISNEGWSALMLAVGQGHEAIVELLLAHSKIQVNLVSNEGWSTLMLAAIEGHKGILKQLLARPDISINLISNEGSSVLMLAAIEGHGGIAKLLLAHPDILVNLFNNEGFSALMLAAGNGHEGIVKLLLARAEIQINQVSNEGWSALLLAAIEGHEGIIKLLLEHPGTLVNLLSNEGWSALMLAANHGHEGMVKLLLARSDIQVNSVNGERWSALMLAAFNGHEGIVSLLLSYPENHINLVNGEGWSTLMLAAASGHEGIVKSLLVRPDIQVNLASNHGWSALILAANNGHFTTVVLLLARRGIQVNLVNDEGCSALILAANNGHGNVVNLLLARSEILVNLVSNEGWSALMLAAGRGRQDIVKLLLDVPHINTMFKTRESGHTAMSFALVQGHGDIVRLLERFKPQPKKPTLAARMMSTWTSCPRRKPSTRR